MSSAKGISTGGPYAARSKTGTTLWNWVRVFVYPGTAGGACAQAAQGCMQDAPRAWPVCPAHPGFRNRLGTSQKASHNWDKGLASVFYVKHAAPSPISASRAAGQPASPAASDRASTGRAPGAWRGMVGLHDAPRVSVVAHVPPVQGSSRAIWASSRCLG